MEYKETGTHVLESIYGVEMLKAPEFKTKDEIFDFLFKNEKTIQHHSGEELKSVVIPLFSSPLLDDPAVMMDVSNWFAIRVSKSFENLVSFNFWELKDVDLSIYKFYILCGIRGPHDDESFCDEIKANIDNDEIDKFASHKDFPPKLKKLFYDKTKDVRFLPEVTKNIFIF